VLATGDDEVTKLENALEQLNRTAEYGAKAYSGFRASTRAAINNGVRAFVPGADYDTAATATQNYEREAAKLAAQAAKTAVGGRVTNYEERIMQKLAPNAGQTPAVRQEALDNMRKELEHELEAQRRKQEAIRGKTFLNPSYVRPGMTANATPGQQGQQGQPSGGSPVAVRSGEEVDALPSGTTYVTPNGQTHRKP
jgi:hypothetical protein